MKKITGKIIKILLGIILFILVLLFTIPVLFKEKIRTKVVQVINESVNATVKFDDYKLGFFRNFPNLTFSLNNVSVVGIDKFQTDTLASIKAFDLVFNLKSLFGKSGYEVKSILVDRSSFNVIYLKDGTANYNIMKPSSEPAPIPEASTTSSGMKILLKKVIITNSSIVYDDREGSMKAIIKNSNFDLSGDMTMNETDLQIAMNAGELTFIMDGIKYLNKVTVDSKLDMLANLDSWKFTFRDSYFSLNDLKINFTGIVIMPKDDIETEMKFATVNSSFKSLLSLVPTAYMSDYKGLKTSGEFSLSGMAKGIYSSADSTMPDVSLAISVVNGLMSYPSSPEQIKNINIKTDVFVDGKDMDKTVVNIDKFHFELAGNPFDMTFALKTPMSDPDFKGSMTGRIDLSALSKAVPMKSISLSGVIDMSAQMAGRMSMIEKKQYDSFKASGTMGIKNMLIAMTGYPEVLISNASFEFIPAYAAMSNTTMKVGGKSDFLLNGHIESYIPYMLSNQAIKGNLSMRSKMTDVSEIMSKMASDTSSAKDTTALTLIQVPKNIDFDFNALIDEFRYDSIMAQKVTGHIIVRDGILSIRDAGMNILGGIIKMNADYDTRDTLNPVMKADFDMQNIGIKDAFQTFNTVKKLAPAAKNIDGRINAKMTYTSLLGRDMMPVINTINGAGKLQSNEITLVESKTFNKMKETLKLGDKVGNTFRDINISFRISDGRIYVSPFDVKAGNIKMNIGGDQGLDQTLNYIVKTEIPRSDLGGSVNSLIDNLSAQASAFGINYKASDILKVNVKVTGTFSNPLVAPFFGSTTGESSGGAKEAVKETVKQVIDNSVDKAKEKAKAEAEAEAAKIVKDAEEKGQALRDEAAKRAEQIRKEADIQAQKLLDGASGTLGKMAAQKAGDALKKTADKQATQVVNEADVQANKLVEEAKAKSAAMVKNI